MVHNQLVKEVCSGCGKNINIGQSTTECTKCSKLVHSKCLKKANFTVVNDNQYCGLCHHTIPIRYNPFRDITLTQNHIQESDENDDHFYNNDFVETVDDIMNASNILEQCKSYSASEISSLIKPEIDFTAFFYNIDGNKTNFDCLAAELHTLKHNFSVVGVAETNIEPQHACLYPLDNYCSFYNEVADGKSKGTGVALYIHDSFKATPIATTCTTTPNIECMFLEVSKGKSSVTVGIIYRPPNGNVNVFLDDFQNTIKSLPRKPTFILGDFNIDLNKENDQTKNHFEEIFLSHGLHPSISLTTHKRNISRGSCIDNIFTNSIDKVSHSGVIHDKGTDHSPIFITSQLNLDSESCKVNAPKQKIYYDFSNKNVDSLVKNLGSKPAHLFGINCHKPNFSKFFSAFSDTVDESCKLQTPRTSKRTTTNNPWITESIIEAIKNKSNLYTKWKKSCTSPSNLKGDASLYNDYSSYRRCLKNVIKHAKAKFYHNKIKSHSHDFKKTWEVINKIRGKNKKTIKPQFVINNVRIIERRIIANEFNKYFVSLASNLNKKYENCFDGIPIEPLMSYEKFMPKSNVNSMFLFECSAEEIRKIISELENGKSSDFPIKIIKSTAHITSPMLACHYNYLMKIGKFPNELKTGKITPIYKKGDEELLENYRPISTLPIFGKIFEKLIYSRLYGFFVSQGLLHDKQFGFRKGHSTSHALNYSVDHINKSLQKGEHVLGIFIDLSKAFDTIDHGILISKLESYGVRGSANSLIKSYLSERTQYVSTLGESSEHKHIEFGVPQGSCLGPLLFLIYINDLCNTGKDCAFVLFADDTNIFVSARQRAEVYRLANSILTRVEEYMYLNKLHINMDKCCYLHFQPKARGGPSSEIPEDTNLEITINQKVIKRVTQTKFLGVIIDDKLSWDAHIKQLTKKLASCSGILNQIKDNIPCELHKNLYHTLFESHLTYGLTVWGGVSNNKLLPLFRIQKRCVRILFGDREAYLDKFKTCARTRRYGEQILGSEFYIKEHSKPLFINKRLMTVYNLYYYHCCMEIFKIMKFRLPIGLYGLFNLSNRKDTLLLTPSPTTQFVYRAAVIWNFCRQKLSILEFSVSIGQLKGALRCEIHDIQSSGDPCEWEASNFSQN
jgi:hypothetical protein